MWILALDLARRMGIAEGEALSARVVETVTLRGTSAENRVRYLGGWLHERLRAAHCDLIVTEAPMNPVASKSDHATIDQLGYYFCLQGIAAVFGVHVHAVPVMSVRKHFCGQACAPRVSGRKRTSAEAQAARKFINTAVLNRAILLGYLPEGSKDWDQANACALFDFACAQFARTLPKELVLFGARP